MKFVGAVLFVLGVAVCVQTVDQIADAFISKVNTDKDGYITAEEIDRVLVTNYDHNKDGCVRKSEFVDQWSKDFHEDRSTAEAFFKVLEDDHDGGCFNAEDIQRHDVQIDANNDSQISVAETKAWIKKVYPTGVKNTAAALIALEMGFFRITLILAFGVWMIM